MLQATARYREVQARTATPIELVILLYEAALRNVRSACGALAARDMEGAHRGFTRAQQAVEELQYALDRSNGPFAEQMYTLYSFLIGELELANVKKDAKRGQDIVPILQELLEAWRGATSAAVPALPEPGRRGSGPSMKGGNL